MLLPGTTSTTASAVNGSACWTTTLSPSSRVPELDPGKYRVRVRATNEAGESRWERVNKIDVGN